MVGAVATTLDTSLGSPGGTVISPVTGTIIRWHVTNFSGGPFALQVLTPNGGESYTATGTSDVATPISTATQTFTTSLPIEAGQTIGIRNTSNSDGIGYFVPPATATSAYFNPALEDGTTRTASAGLEAEFMFNAEVQPPPTITALTPESGPIAGAGQVTIAGTDFENVLAVKFGDAPATTFAVDSEMQITAFAPAGAGAVPVAVTTLAGTATAPQAYTYVTPTPVVVPTTPVQPPTPTVTVCKVPNLKGKSLKGAKKALRAHHCKPGTVTIEADVTAKTGSVVKQSPKAGTTKRAESAVGVRLG